MNTKFPAFRRLFGTLGTLLGGPVRTNRAKQRSLLRLIAVATEENIALHPLIGAWAADETGPQSVRLLRLAERLRHGAPLADAIEEVQGVLSPEDVLAVRFGSQSGTLAASLRDQLDQTHPHSGHRSLQMRHYVAYFGLITIVAAVIIAFLQIRIVPVLNAIIQEFDIAAPSSLRWSVTLANTFADYWYVFLLIVVGLWLLLFSTRPGRQLRLRLSGQFFQPIRELRFADVMQKLSITTKAGRPIAGALSTLARYHFDPALRYQLLFIRNELEHGADIWQCMGRIGLLSAAEVRVLKSSEQIGNRSWALQRLAQLRTRRAYGRLARWSGLAFPLVVITIGAFVLLQTLSIFESLVQILYSLL